LYLIFSLQNVEFVRGTLNERGLPCQKSPSTKTTTHSFRKVKSGRPGKWTREHFLIALNLYCKLPFGQLHRNNPVIVETAAKMGRTSNSLAMKLCNFAALDPVQTARGIRGLTGATKQDRSMWHEFHSNLPVLGAESEQLLHDLFTRDETKEVDFLARDKVRLVPPSGPTETQASVKARRGQQFFRQAVLTAYDVRCCISGINVPRLLVASHIKPWGKFPDHRLNPRNGLCLSTLHDAAFDAGLITLDEKLAVVLSKRLRSFFPQPALEQNFVPYEGKPIQLPEKLAEPDTDFLRYHRDVLFEK
jgi:putative restriction endonuclease